MGPAAFGGIEAHRDPIHDDHIKGFTEVASSVTEDTQHARRYRPFTPPSRWLSLAEPRAAGEAGVSLALMPLLLRAPRGDGHPVLSLPGFLAGDSSTILLRFYLKQLGYDARAWKMGLNLGGVRKMEASVRAMVEEIAIATGRRITMVGWSLGGIYARLTRSKS